MEADVSLHLHAKFQSCLLIFDVVCCSHNICLQPLPKVATRSPLCYERLLSTHVSNVPCVSNVLLVVGVVFGPCVDACSLGNFQVFANFMFMRLSRGFTFGDHRTSSDTSCTCSSVGLPHGGLVGVKDVIIKAWNGSFDTALSVDDASVKKAVVACCATFPSCVFRLFSWLREGFVCLCTLSFV